MSVTRSSASALSSSLPPFDPRRLRAALPFIVAASISTAAVWYFAAHGWLLYYGDAEAHLNIARRLFDNRTPSLEQFGVPWLPVPHLITAPFAAVDALWHSGLAGAIPSAMCFIAAAVFLFRALEEIFGSRVPAWIGMLIFLANPNVLYLQSTSMTEAAFAACLFGLLDASVRFRRTQSEAHVAAAAIFATLGTLTRYEGWALLPFCAVYFFLVARRRWTATLTFCAIAALGPAIWLFYNWWLSGDPLEFARGPGSAKAIQGGVPYPGLHDWKLSWLYFRTDMRLALGAVLFWIGAAGLAAALLRRRFWPVLLLSLPPVFYIFNLHSGDSPIHMPELWPHSWYNTRYALAALPLAAFCAAAITRRRAGLLLVVLAILPWILHPNPEHWITWKESQVNSVSRRAWTDQSAAWLRRHREPGDTVMSDFDDTIGIFRYAQIPLREVFHPGNGLAWEAAIQRPELFMNSGWVVCQRRKSSRLSQAMAHAAHYHRVHTITVPGAEPIDFYKYANPFYESPWRAERLPALVDKRSSGRV